MSSAKTYNPPVSQLLTLGHPNNIKDWATYLNLGITETDIPELARMAVDRTLFDSEEGDECFALIHAWRTLAELQTEKVIEPLIATLIQWGNADDWWDWESEELPVVFGRLGAMALPALSEVLANPKYDNYARQDAVHCIREIFLRDPATRADCIQVLTAQLEKFTKNDPELNAYIVTTLAADIKAVEAAAIIEQAYRSGHVNEDFIGDWDDAQVYLGLKERSELPKRNRNIITNPWRYNPPKPDGFTIGQSKTSKTKASIKRKQQKESRRKNRSKK